ncbi:hypothetical protein ACFL07_04140 [Pseudomonadota bacterium]
MLKKHLSWASFPSKLRPALNITGAILGLAGVAFVCIKISQQLPEIRQYSFDKSHILLFSMLAVVYGSANSFLAAGWHLILKRLGVNLNWKLSMSAYGISQLAKYVPGNIFQFVGRQALGVSVGIPGGKLAKSAIIEIIFLVIAAMLLSIQAVQLWLPHLSGSATFLTISLLIVVCFCVLLLRKETLLSRTLLFNMFFFITSGLVFWGVVSSLTDHSIEITQISKISSAFIFAWLLGFLTPGAPAGLGVREYIILTSLTGIASEPLLLLSVIVSRVITMGGDMIFYSAAVTVKIFTDKSRAD